MKHKQPISVPCPLCDSKRYTLRFKLNGWQLVQCQECHFVYVNPRPPQQEVEQVFSASTDSSAQEHIVKLSSTYQSYYTHAQQEEIKKQERILQQLAALVHRPPSQCSLLDVGCGSGAFLQHALAAGFEAYGCDLGDWSLDLLRQKNLLPRVFIGHIEEGPYADESFDIIHLRAVLGHLYAPAAFLKQLRRKLKPGGILALLGTPNIDSIFIRLGIDSFDGNVPLIHLSFFSTSTVEWLVRREGFRLLSTRTWGVPLRLTYPSALQKLVQGDSKHNTLPRYYQSEQELSITHWQNSQTQQHLSSQLKTICVYQKLKELCNMGLNMINGGQVIDVVAMKE